MVLSFPPGLTGLKENEDDSLEDGFAAEESDYDYSDSFEVNTADRYRTAAKTGGCKAKQLFLKVQNFFADSILSFYATY